VSGQTGDPEARGLFQIGDLARRVGVGVDTLRAWERRYGLLHPQRSAGGFRLYSAADEATVRAMLAEIRRGFSPAQAAKLALSHSGRSSGPASGPATGSEPVDPAAAPAERERSADRRGRLREALLAFDGRAAHELVDALFAEFTLNAVLDDVVLPCLHELGDLWEAGEVSVAQEHFASNLIRERLLGLARQWDHGRGPRAVLACPPGERHDIALICFGLALGAAGWRIVFLGPDTPIDTLAEVSRALEADVVVLAATDPARFAALTATLRPLAAARPVLLAGAGATAAAADACGARLLAGTPVSAADGVAAGTPAGQGRQ
jgi:MerR family transcriptional regulator, light-induced transcriptional regulator